MEKKFKIEFEDTNVQYPMTYLLMKDFNLIPNILKAEIAGDGSGIMIVTLTGKEEDMNAAITKIESMGFHSSELGNHIHRDKDRCFSCGACVSVCPTRSFSHDPETYEVHLNIDTCIACGSCVDSCSAKALKLII